MHLHTFYPTHTYTHIINEETTSDKEVFSEYTTVYRVYLRCPSHRQRLAVEGLSRTLTVASEF